MDTLAAFDLIDSVETAIAAAGSFGTSRERTRKFLEALHERGLMIQGKPKPAQFPLCCEVSV